MIPSSCNWFNKPPASTEAIDALRNLESVDLPPRYLQLLAFSNGGEGPLSIQPWNFCLDSAEVAAKYWRERSFAGFFPSFFVFGGSGGGELIAFDLHGEKPWPVVALDATNCDLRDAVLLVAKDFDAFMDILGKEKHA